MEARDKIELLSNLVFSNEVILDKLFSCIPTQELHLSTNRVNRAWNAVVDKIVHLKRKIFLNNANIYAYCKLIENGGACHRNISLDLNCNEECQNVCFSKKAERILSTIGIIGPHVQELKLESSCWHDKRAKRSQSNLFRQLVRQSPNIVGLSLKISELCGVNPNKLFYSGRYNLSKLQILTLEELDYSERMKLLVSFATHSPNIQQINWSWDDKGIPFEMEDLHRLEELDPQIFGKLSLLAFENLDEAVANFLVSKDFRELRKLIVTDLLELPALSMVLEKYGGQLTHMILALGEVWKNPEYDGLEEWEFPIFQLPVMKNLENLGLSYFGMEGDKPKWPIIRFWDCAENSRVFQKLNCFAVHFTSYSQIHSDAILADTFQASTVHPIFPNVIRNEDGSEGGIIRGNSRVIELMSRYFPNAYPKVEISQ